MKKVLSDYFIPKETNTHKPHFLRKKALFTLVIAVLVVELVFVAHVFLGGNLHHMAAVLPGVLVSLTNETREASDLNILTENSLLTQAAQLKANDMAEKGYFAHTSPDGKEPWYWLKQAGYSYSYAGENLAVNFIDSSDVTDAWMKSPSHRANMINDHYTEIGIAVAKGVYKGKSTLFVVQFFGTPKTGVIPQPTVPTQVVTVPKPTQAAVKPAPKVLGSETESVPPSAPVVPVSQESVAPAMPSVQAVSQEPAHPIVEKVETASTAPRVLANFIFSVLILLVATALALAIFIRIRIQHPPMIAGAVAVIVFLAGIMYFNEFVIGNDVGVPNDIVAATIQSL